MDEGLDKGVKIAQPDLYYGERDKLESWLTQISLYLAFMGDKIPPTKHATFAITYLRGRAQKWVEPFLKKYMEEPDEPGKRRNQTVDGKCGQVQGGNPKNVRTFQ